MKFSKIFLLLSISILGINVIAATITRNDRHKTDYNTGWSPGPNVNMYAAVGQAQGCSFNTNATYTTGGAEIRYNTSSIASAELAIIHTEYPATGSFPFSVRGKLGGSGGGTALTWSAALQQKFFWLTQAESIVKAGTDVTVSANGAPIESTWIVNNKNWKDSDDDHVEASSIVLNASLWTDMEWNPDPVPDGFDPPTAGRYTITAYTTEDVARSAEAIAYVVEITSPAKNGSSNKWVSDRYDCQAVKSGTTGSYNLGVVGNWATRSDGQWSLSAAKGTIASATSSSTTYSPPATEGSVDLRLKFTATGSEILDTRSITIFKDHLARDYFNFGHDRSCETDKTDDGVKFWEAETKYGLTPRITSAWNCFGSVVHAYNNTGNGYSGADDSISGRTWIRTLTKPANQTFSSNNIGSIQRGDVIFYKMGSLKLHASTVIDATNKNTYGANNKTPTVLPWTWKWYKGNAGEWANGIYKVHEITIEVYR